MTQDANSPHQVSDLTISPANREDSKDIFDWRNDEVTVQMSVSNQSVSWETHCRWIEETLNNPNRYLFLASFGETEKVGMCRFDLSADHRSAEVSINLNPRHRGKKIASHVLSAAIKKFTDIKNIDLTAIIKKSNAGSIKCFENCGFTLSHQDFDFNYYKLRSKK